MKTFEQKLDQFVERNAVEYAEIHLVFKKEMYGNIKADHIAGSNSLKPIVLKLVEALDRIKESEGKCLLGPRISESDDMIEKASSSDDLMCWSHELGSSKAYNECGSIAGQALAEVEKILEGEK